MKTIIASKKAPGAIGPYSQACVHGGVIYVSGQLPLDPTSGKPVSGTVGEQTTKVLENIKAIVEEAGSNMGNILKCTVLLTDMVNFTHMNEAYAKFFPENPPARIAYEVSVLPLGADVEIDAICAV